MNKMAHNLQASEKVKASSEFQALHHFMHGHGDVSSAQEKFCEPVEDKFMTTANADDVESSLWTAWSAVTGTAAQTPFESDKRQKLADFILRLKTRPDLQKGETVCKVWDETVWKDLPTFGAQLRDVWNFTPNNNDSHEAEKYWLDLNAFVATITAKTPEYALFAIWTIRSGLEEQNTTKVGVEAAAIWLLYAGPAIFALCKENKSYDGKLAAPGPRFSDKSWTGFSVERWRSWASRLEEVQGEGQRSEQLITRARKTMGEILER